ncbi:MAG: putative signal transducing protein [Terriglobia bacterium]
MAYCPECGTEYKEGATDCPDCEMRLKPGRPPAHLAERQEGTSKLMRIRVFTGPSAVMAADLARNLLQTERIPCMLPGEYTAEMLPGVEPVQVFVRECDAERASEILQAYFDTSEPAR